MFPETRVEAERIGEANGAGREPSGLFGVAGGEQSRERGGVAREVWPGVEAFVYGERASAVGDRLFSGAAPFVRAGPSTIGSRSPASTCASGRLVFSKTGSVFAVQMLPTGLPGFSVPPQLTIDGLGPMSLDAFTIATDGTFDISVQVPSLGPPQLQLRHFSFEARRTFSFGG